MPWIDKDEVLNRITTGEVTIPASDDSYVDVLIPYAERAIRQFLGYEVAQATYTEFLPPRDEVPRRDTFLESWDVIGQQAVLIDGQGQDVIVLRNAPVRSVSAVYENASAQLTAGGSWDASHLLTEGTHYAVDYDESGLCWSGIVYRTGGTWSRKRRTIKVTYSAGFTSAELEPSGTYGIIQDAGIATVLAAFNVDGAVNRLDVAVTLPPAVQAMLLDYIHPAKLIR